MKTMTSTQEGLCGSRPTVKNLSARSSLPPALHHDMLLKIIYSLTLFALAASQEDSGCIMDKDR